MDLLPIVTDSPWQLIQEKSNAKGNKVYEKTSVKRNKDDATLFVVAKGTVPVSTVQKTGTKCKASSEDTPDLPQKKKTKLSFVPMQDSPVDIAWDGENYSCAYDALFTILCDI